MMLIATDRLRPGMRVGRSIRDISGRILLTSGTELKQSYIDRLGELGIPAVYIWNELAPDVAAEDVVSPETRHRLAVEIQQTMADLRTCLQEQGRNHMRRWRPDVASLRTCVSAVISEILSNRHAMVHLRDIRSHDEYTMGHSVNVCILASLVGVSLGLDPGTLRELGVGAILHDVGKVTIPLEILNKVEPLTNEELDEVRKHAERGFEILRHQPEFSLHCAHVAYQHHERWNGSGYPRGLRGTEIHELARIVAVVDVYDAMTADRPYRRGHSPDRAIMVMREMMSDWFDPRVLAAFIDNIAVYPIGSVVELSTGQIAVVTEVVRGRSERPRVRVVKEEDGSRISRPFEIDLSQDRSISIVRVVTEPAPSEQLMLASSGGGAAGPERPVPGGGRDM